MRHGATGDVPEGVAPIHRDTIDLSSELEVRLHRALEVGDLEVHFQPVVGLPSGRHHGYEALCRWDDPVLGPVPPDAFIPVAERTGLIHALGREVLRSACRTAASWVADDHGLLPGVSVNVSPVQLTDHRFVDEVVAALETSQLAPERMCLEITESAAVVDLTGTSARLRALRELGVRVALDDFGVGHSPLTILRSLPLDVLKIDRTFVAHVHDRARDTLIVRLVVDAAHAMGLHVCAEGVETLEQAQQLVALGCDSAQGWLYGRATRAHDLPASGAASARTAIDPALPPPVRILGSTDELVLITTDRRMIRTPPPGRWRCWAGRPRS